MKTIKTIIRTDKIKTIQQLHNVGAHNNRLKDVPNASYKHDIKRLIGTSNLVQDVKTIMSKHGLAIDKLRKNAVICNELVLSLSPEYFEDGELDYKGKFNKKNTLDFIKKAKIFLENKYQNKLAHLSVHLDESTPHIHAIVVPTYLDSVTGSYKLAAKRLFDRSDLQLLQKEYCGTFKTIKKYTFSYKEKSMAKHQDIKTFYKELETTKSSLTSESEELKRNIQLLKKNNQDLEQEIKSSLFEKVTLKNELIDEQEKVLKLEEFINTTLNLLKKVSPIFLNKLREIFSKKDNDLLKGYLSNQHMMKIENNYKKTLRKKENIAPPSKNKSLNSKPKDL
ncbi:plasmid recombination protein [Colwellia sp. UCD-KL20]|uniref:plasmid recombination protein n=1 Tax=Colwellia sp. UCD-KL20 TaxID=1917165 RepID=UPI000970B38C|nr:plasmid recombination protein [Colwellia sp. UCD-KL20]